MFVWFLAIILSNLLISCKSVQAALTINDVSPTTINSADDVITITATASGLSSSTQYLQAAITRDGSASNYLGLTKNLSGEWYLYKSSPTTADLSNYFYSFTPTGSTWSGQLQAKIDINDDGFLGPGNYILKLIKYISSSGSYSNNSIAITINVASPSSQTAISPPTPPSPNITLSIGNSFVLGADFTSSVKLENFDPNQSYYLKMRAGTDENTLNKAQTKNGSAYLSDTESWNKFPQISTDGSGKWEGQLTGRIGEDKSPGSYKIRLRVRRSDNDTFYDSEIKAITLSSPPPIPPVVEAPKQITVAAPLTNKDIDINLVLGTASAATISPIGITSVSSVLKNPNQDKEIVPAPIIFIVLGSLISTMALLSIKFKILENLFNKNAL